MTLRFGKYRGRDLGDVPASYLAWLLEEATDLREPLASAIRAELVERLDLEPATRWLTVPARPPADLVPAVRVIVRAGYRQAAMRAHPDHGGQAVAMRRLTEAREWLTAHVCWEVS